jgi:hypothetical protein
MAAAKVCPGDGRGAGDDPAPPEVIDVELGEDEEVRWIWTHTAEGESFVTGYEIVEKDGDGGEPGA